MLLAYFKIMGLLSEVRRSLFLGRRSKCVKYGKHYKTDLRKIVNFYVPDIEIDGT